jgi:hypothetical protein
MAKWLDGGGGRSTALAFCLHRAEPGDCKKAAAGLAYINFPFVRCPQIAIKATALDIHTIATGGVAHRL